MVNVSVTAKDRARYTFLLWLSEKHPEIYRRIVTSRPAQLSGFLDSLQTIFTTTVEKLPSLADQYVKTKAQLDQLKLNLELARAGQPIVDVTGQQLPLAPVPAQNALILPAPGAINPIWLAVGGLVLFMLLRR